MNIVLNCGLIVENGDAEVGGSDLVDLRGGLHVVQGNALRDAGTHVALLELRAVVARLNHGHDLVLWRGRAFGDLVVSQQAGLVDHAHAVPNFAAARPQHVLSGAAQHLAARRLRRVIVEVFLAHLLVLAVGSRLLRTHAHARMEISRLKAGHRIDQLVGTDMAAILHFRLLNYSPFHALIFLHQARVLGPFDRVLAALHITRRHAQSGMRVVELPVSRVAMLRNHGPFLQRPLLVMMRHELAAGDRVVAQGSHLLALLTMLQQTHRFLLSLVNHFEAPHARIVALGQGLDRVLRLTLPEQTGRGPLMMPNLVHQLVVVRILGVFAQVWRLVHLGAQRISEGCSAHLVERLVNKHRRVIGKVVIADLAADGQGGAIVSSVLAATHETLEARKPVELARDGTLLSEILHHLHGRGAMRTLHDVVGECLRLVERERVTADGVDRKLSAGLVPRIIGIGHEAAQVCR